MPSPDAENCSFANGEIARPLMHWSAKRRSMLSQRADGNEVSWATMLFLIEGIGSQV
jgi:hypothetical protein